MCSTPMIFDLCHRELRFLSRWRSTAPEILWQILVLSSSYIIMCATYSLWGKARNTQAPRPLPQHLIVGSAGFSFFFQVSLNQLISAPALSWQWKRRWPVLGLRRHSQSFESFLWPKILSPLWWSARRKLKNAQYSHRTFIPFQEACCSSQIFIEERYRERRTSRVTACIFIERLRFAPSYVRAWKRSGVSNGRHLWKYK